jgi:acylglycerol lipase
MGSAALDRVVHATYRFKSDTGSGHKLFAQLWIPETCLLEKDRVRKEIDRSISQAPAQHRDACKRFPKASDYGDFGQTLSVEELRLLRYDAKKVRALVLFLHGLHSNSSFGTMDPLAPGERHRKYEGSVPQHLNEQGILVFAHDHMGHGRTLTASGKIEHRVVDRFRTLELDTLRHIEIMRSLASSEELSEESAPDQPKPLFIIGESMGGLLAVSLALHYPDRLFPTGTRAGGLVLIAPAVLPPRDMFGVKGRILYQLSGVVSALFPRLDAVQIPGCTLFPEIQKEFDTDEWTGRGKLKARLGREIIQAQKEVATRINELRCPFLALYGTEDTLTNPQNGLELFQRASSSDKETIVLEGMWHILLFEPRAQEARSEVFSWILARS